MRRLIVTLTLILAVGALAACEQSTPPTSASSDGLVAAATTCTFTTTGGTMTLDDDCTTDETLFVPDGFTLDGAGHTITAVDPAGGHFLGAVVANTGDEAHVTNLGITTDDLANVCDGTGPPDNRLRGILFDGADGSIVGNTITDLNQGASGCQEGNAIEVRNAPFDGTHPATRHVEIAGNTIIDFQKTGIVANGDVDVDLRGNDIEGSGPTSAIAQNSIQIGFGGRGHVSGNVVGGTAFTGDDWTASGILVFEADESMIQDNVVVASQVGIAIESWCWFAPTADGNKVMKNEVRGGETGISVVAVAFPGLSTCDARTDNNKVNNNLVAADGNPDADTGILVAESDGDGDGVGFEPVADNTKIIHNDVDGYPTPFDASGTDTKTHANDPSAP